MTNPHIHEPVLAPEDDPEQVLTHCETAALQAQVYAEQGHVWLASLRNRDADALERRYRMLTETSNAH